VAEKPLPKPSHSVSDHAYGADALHAHDSGGEYDHDHDDFGADATLEDNPIWRQDNLSLVSVGIDIGSAGTQLVFARLNLRRLGEDLTSRYFVVSREALYQSPVTLTPYASEERIDDRRLGEIIDRAYQEAQLHPDSIDSGVVILTGEALRRENAQAIADLLADQGGEFVCATAGHNMEAMLAAYGSGAAKVSHDQGTRVLNIDIGGGTTKLALIDKGNVLATAALHIGGRLLVIDDERRIVRLDPAGRYLAMQAGFAWTLGDPASVEDVAHVAKWMADALIAALCERPAAPAIERLYLTDPIADLGRIDGVMFSGGVGEYVYAREHRDFGDWGYALGGALREAIAERRFPWPVLPAGECIRATALGASEYSVQLSGNTTYISEPGELLPRRNLQVLQPQCELGHRIDSGELARAIRHRFTAFDLNEGESDVALAFHWQGSPSYERVAAFVSGLTRGLAHTIANGRPIYVILDGDVAQTVGGLLKDEFGVESPVLVIDGITLRDFDFIDLGRIRLPSNTVPVTIKSLVFSEDPRSDGAHPHLAGYREVPRQHRHHFAHAHGHFHGKAQAHHHAGSHPHDHDDERGHSSGGHRHEHGPHDEDAGKR